MVHVIYLLDLFPWLCRTGLLEIKTFSFVKNLLLNLSQFFSKNRFSRAESQVMLSCKQGTDSTGQHTALQQNKMLQKHSFRKMLTVQFLWVTKLSGLLLYVPSSHREQSQFWHIQSVLAGGVGWYLYHLRAISHGSWVFQQPEQLDVFLETSGKLLTFSSIISRFLKRRKLCGKAGFFST